MKRLVKGDSVPCLQTSRNATPCCCGGMTPYNPLRLPFLHSNADVVHLSAISSNIHSPMLTCVQEARVLIFTARLKYASKHANYDGGFRSSIPGCSRSFQCGSRSSVWKTGGRPVNLGIQEVWQVRQRGYLGKSENLACLQLWQARHCWQASSATLVGTVGDSSNLAW